MIQQSALKSLSFLINQCLKFDQTSRQRLQSVANKRIAIECLEPKLAVLISVDSQAILTLSADLANDADVHLSGRFSAFVELLSSDDKASALINSGLSLKGNSQILLDLVESVQQLDIDWEYHAAQLLGDLPAHYLGKLGRYGQRFFAQSRPVFKRHLKEFLLEEAALIPAAHEIEQFIDAVQALKLRTERLEAKLARLNTGDKL